MKAEGDHLQKEVERKFQMATLFQITADDFSCFGLALARREGYALAKVNEQLLG